MLNKNDPRRFEKPKKETYGCVVVNTFDGEVNYWPDEDSKEAYAEALVLWENESKLDSVDCRNNPN